MVGPKGGQAPLQPAHFSASPPVGGGPVGNEFFVAAEGPAEGWAGRYLQGSLWGEVHDSDSWAPFRDAGKGKQEGLDHREARSRKKHSAKLGPKPFPSCVKTPERLGRRPEEVPCLWIQGSGRPGRLRPSSLLHKGLMGGLASNIRVLGSLSPSGPPATSSGQVGLFKVLPLVPSMRAAQTGGRGEKTHPPPDTWRVPRLPSR